MSYTSYLKLAKPAFDAAPWDQAVNGNMDTIDGFLAQFMAVPNFAGTWSNSTSYVVGQVTLDGSNATLWQCQVTHTSAASPTTFYQDRLNNPTYWLNATTAPPPQLSTNVGRNLLHNSLFNVAQRGAGPFTANGYTLDRWAMFTANGTSSITWTSMSDTSRAQIGDEAAENALGNTFVGSATAGSYNLIAHSIEDVRRLSGKTVTVSFWAQATAGTPKLGVSLNQNFGTGGSPSATVAGAGSAVTLSTTWARYQVTFSLPSVAGKTIGSNKNHCTILNLWYSAEATYAVGSGNIGVQSGTVYLWGIQLEIGSVATPLEKPDPADDLCRCQRFYQVGVASLFGYQTSGGQFAYNLRWPTQMRATPTVSVSVITATQIDAGGAIFTATASGTGTLSFNQNYTASADL
jgi:hypothetical protein